MLWGKKKPEKSLEKAVPGPELPKAHSTTSGVTDLSSSFQGLTLKEDGKQSDGKKGWHYAADRIIGSGSFGVVYQATSLETQETVAIKKVLQDPRFKNRELKVLSSLAHPAIVSLKHCFYSKGSKPDEKYLNLVMEYIPETIHRTLCTHSKANKLVRTIYVKVYMYQVARALGYIHSLGICHRDLKPQNLLLDTESSIVKLCDFGSAKVLMPGQPNVAYICSRYYRAPELVFEATEYTCAIDMWSFGCVMAELLLGSPVFPGDSSMDQLVQIVKILGTPTRAQLMAMNPAARFDCEDIVQTPWNQVFRTSSGHVPPEALDLLSKILRYEPMQRLTPMQTMAHPFFDELRQPNVKLPNSKPLPPIFNFTDAELQAAASSGLLETLVPKYLRAEFPAYFDA